jgi:hypothetical protein
VPHHTDPPRDGRGRWSVADAKVTQERVACWELRLQGHSFAAITALVPGILGYPISEPTVRRRVHDHGEELEAGPREAYLRYELDRLDRLTAAVSTAAFAGDLGAVDRLLKISESRRRLLGLDAAVKVDATVTEVTQADLELQELLREAQARAAESVA